jgi:hypothetical protein
MPKPLRLPNASEQAVLDGLHLRLLTEPQDKQRWDQLVIERHYLKSASLVGEQLRYVGEYQGQWLALLGWSAPALHLKAREAWIGWSPEQLRQRRHLLAQNSRLVLLADRQQFPNLATRALGLCCRRLSVDWLKVHGHPIVAVESFVDSQLMFRGTAYKAAGWTLLGPTAGFGRCAEDFYQRHDRPKQLWVRALDPEGTAALKTRSLPPRLAPYEAAAQCRPLAGKPLLSLLERLPAVPEPRATNGRRHPWPAIQGMVCLAKLAGVAGAQRDVAEFAQRLNQRQRRQLGCYRNPKTGLREVPSPSTFFRALRAVSYDCLEALLVGWQDDLLGPADPKELVVLDGKAVRGAGGQVVISAVAVPSGRVLGVEVVRTKEELQPDDRPQATSAAAAPANLPVGPAPAAPATPALATPASAAKAPPSRKHPSPSHHGQEGKRDPRRPPPAGANPHQRPVGQPGCDAHAAPDRRPNRPGSRRRLSADPQRQPADPDANRPKAHSERLFSLRTRSQGNHARPARRRKTVTVTKCANWSTVRSNRPSWAWSGPSKWPAWTKNAPTKARANPRRCGWPPAAAPKPYPQPHCWTLAVASGASKTDCIMSWMSAATKTAGSKCAPPTRWGCWPCSAA